MSENQQPLQQNVFGEPIELCSDTPLTGWFRDGCCNTDENDRGMHTVCAKVSDEFLNWLKEDGNDLITPHPEFGFPGLKAGDRWCVCALRWKEAFKAGCAPKVILEATHEKSLQYINIEDLIVNRYSANLED